MRKYFKQIKSPSEMFESYLLLVQQTPEEMWEDYFNFRALNPLVLTKLQNTQQIANYHKYNLFKNLLLFISITLYFI